MQDRAVFRDLPADIDGHTDWSGAHMINQFNSPSAISAAAFAVLIFQLIMQTSYRLCPPSEAEIAEEPALVKYAEEKR